MFCIGWCTSLAPFSSLPRSGRPSRRRRDCKDKSSSSNHREEQSPARAWFCAARKARCCSREQQEITVPSPSRDLPAGSYWLEVAAPSFQVRHVTVEVSAQESRPVEIVLSLAGFQSEVTVTTERGMAADVERTPPIVTVRDADDFRNRPDRDAWQRARRRCRSDGSAEHIRSGLAVPAWSDRLSRAQSDRRHPVQQFHVPVRAEPVPGVRRS